MTRPLPLLALLLACQERVEDTAALFRDDDGDGYSEHDGDCDDADAEVSPDGVELCDGKDNDCDGVVDDDPVDGDEWFMDADGDGYGRDYDPIVSCTQPSGYVRDSTDCWDDTAVMHPGAVEICDGVDNDCDGEVDENSAYGATLWFVDADGDGHGDPAAFVDRACEQFSGTVDNRDDCAHTDPAINPAATEACNGVDDDCDGEVDDGC